MQICSSSSYLSLPSHSPQFKPHLIFIKARKPLSKTLNPYLPPSKNPSFSQSPPSKLTYSPKPPHTPFSSPSNNNETEVELLGKPSPVSVPDEEESPTSSKSIHLDDALAPFLKFFKARDLDEKDLFGQNAEISNEKEKIEERERIGVEYYDPRPGDFVVGVVVSGNDSKMDVNIGADMLGTMLTKEVLPFYDAEFDYLCFDLGKDGDGVMVSGKMGVVKDEEASGASKVSGRSVVELGSVIFAEVFGRTLSGRPLLSCRRMFRRVAWHRVRQVLFSIFV